MLNCTCNYLLHVQIHQIKDTKYFYICRNEYVKCHKISMGITNSPCLLTFVQCLLKVKMALRASLWSSSCHSIFVLMWSQYGCLITSLHVQWLQYTVVTRSPFGMFLVRFLQAKAMAGKVIPLGESVQMASHEGNHSWFPAQHQPAQTPYTRTMYHKAMYPLPGSSHLWLCYAHHALIICWPDCKPPGTYLTTFNSCLIMSIVSAGIVVIKKYGHVTLLFLTTLLSDRNSIPSYCH